MYEFKKLIECGELAHTNGLVIGTGGNLSIRRGGDIVIKKSRADMSSGQKESYISVPLDKLEKDVPDGVSSEAPLHAACYGADSRVGAVAHVHAPYSIAAAAKANVLESTSYEFDCILGPSVPVIDFIKPGSAELGREVARYISAGAGAVLMKKHGSVAVGRDIEQAFLRALALERAAITFLHS